MLVYWSGMLSKQISTIKFETPSQKIGDVKVKSFQPKATFTDWGTKTVDKPSCQTFKSFSLVFPILIVKFLKILVALFWFTVSQEISFIFPLDIPAAWSSDALYRNWCLAVLK